MRRSLYQAIIIPLGVAVAFAPRLASANPLGGVVVGGSATISGEGTATTTIHQTTDRAIINWQDFSIGLGELTQFVQPGANAAALNRVISGNPSQLLGSLQANGSVFLINQNGILVGPNAHINAGTFLGSTLDLADDAFLSGANMTFSGSSGAGVENLGTINALGGDIFLFGHTVKNSGTLKAGGTVGLAAGTSIELRQAGNERIGVILGSSSSTQSEVGVNNLGVVEAAAAEVKAAGGNIYALAINNGGEIRATPKLVFEGGRIVLKSEGGTVINRGTLDASNDNPGGTGGEVQVLGRFVGVMDGGAINVSGDAGGGTILVGGDFQGNNPEIPNAFRTYVGENTTLNADALTSGDGGRIIVWADDVTRYLGHLSARGGTGGGDGGFAEVSGKESLIFRGSIDLDATLGIAGTLLLDPKNIIVQGDTTADGAGDTISTNDQFAENATGTVTFRATGTGSLVAALQAGNVTLQANNDITFSSAVSVGSGNSTLTLQAGRSILINANISTQRAFTATANDTSAQSGNRDSGAAEFTMASGTSIAVVQSNRDITIIMSTGAGGQTSGDITLGNLTTSGNGNVFVTNNGTTPGSDILRADASSLITANNIKLDVSAGANTGGSVGTSANPIRVTAGGGVDTRAQSGGIFLTSPTTGIALGFSGGGSLTDAFDTSGDITITAAGSITQSKKGSASGGASIATFSVSNGSDITLNNTGNDVNRLVISTTQGTARDVTFTDANAFELGNITVSRDLTLTSGGNLTQQSGTSISATGGTTRLAATTANDITLDNSGNNFSTLRIDSGNNVTIRDADGFSFGGANSTVTGGLNVTLTGTGNLTQANNLSVGGTATFDVGSGNDIVLNRNGNALATVVVTSARDVTLADADGYAIGGSSISRDLTASVVNGNLTDSGTVNVGRNASFTVSANGNSINLDTLNVTGTITLNTGASGATSHATIINAGGIDLATSNVRGNLSATATTGNLTDSGTVTVAGTGTFVTSAADADIDLGTLAVTGAITLSTAGTSGDAMIVNSTAVNLAASTINGNLTATATTGNLTDSGTVTVTGNASFTASANGAMINVDQLAVSGTITLNTGVSGSTSHATVVNATGIDLAASNVRGNLSATATTGSIIDSGTVTVAGTATFSTTDDGDVDLGTLAVTGSIAVDTNNGGAGNGHATLINATGIDFMATTDVKGDLTATATTGNLTDSGTVTVGGNASFATSAADADINLGTLAVTGSITLNTAGTTGDATIVNASAVNLAASTVNGGLTATATTGNLTDSGTVTVAGNASFTTSNADDDIDLGTLAVSGTISLNTSGTGGDAAIVNAGTVNFATSGVGGMLTATATSGDIIQSGALTVGGDASFTIDSAGADSADILLHTQANSFGGTVTFVESNADALRDAGLRDTTAFNYPADLTIPALNTLRDFYLVLNQAIDLPATTVGRNLSVTAAGGITQSGTLTIPGLGTFSAAGFDITLTDGANTFGSAAFPAGATVMVTDAGALTLAGADLTGSMTVVTGGALDQSTSPLLIDVDLTITVPDSFSVDLSTQPNDIAGTVTINGNLSSFAFRNDNANATVPVFTGGTGDLILNVPASDITLPNTILTGRLEVTANKIIINGANIQTGGNQQYHSPVEVHTDSTLTVGGALTFDDTVDGNTDTMTGFALIIDATGGTTISGIFGGNQPLTSLTVGGGTVNIGANITTDGNTQIFNAPVVLTTHTMFSDATGDLIFNNTIDGDGNGPWNGTFTAAGTVQFNGPVGVSDPLNSIVTTGQVQIGANIRFGAGTSTFNNAVTLTANVDLSSLANATLIFADTLDSDGTARALSFDMGVGSATTTFQGEVGGISALASFSANPDGVFHIDGGLIEADGAISFGLTSIELGADTVLRSNTGALVSIIRNINGTGAGTESLTIEGDFDGPSGGFAIGSGMRLEFLTVTGSTTLRSTNPTAVATELGQTYQGAVTLNENTTLTSANNGAISFDTTVDSQTAENNSLTVTTGGTTTFGGAVGTVRLSTLAVDGVGAIAINGGTVNTTGDQSYTGDVTLGAVTSLDASGAMAIISFGGTLAAGANALTLTAGEINFGGNVTGSSTLELLPNSSVAAVFVGGANNNADANLDISGADIGFLQNGFTLITIGGSGSTLPVTVSGVSSFPSPVTLNSDGVGGSVTINAQLDTLAGSGAMVLNGATIRLGADLRTDGDQITLNSGAGIVLTADVTIDTEANDDGNAGAVSITATSISGDADGHDLTIDTSTTFGTGIGGAINLVNMDAAGGSFLHEIGIDSRGGMTDGVITGSGISITTNDDGATESIVSISGNLQLSGVNSIDVSDSTFQGGSVNLQNATVSATAANTSLSINATGTGQDGGRVDLGVFDNTGGSNLDSLSVTATGNANGAIDFWGASITTTAAQTYSTDGGFLRVGLTMTGEGITFNTPLDNNFSLQINDTGVTSFNGVVGGTTPLSSLTTDSDGSVTINTTAISAQGGTISFEDPVTLTSDVVITDSGATGVFFNNTVESDATPRALTVNTTGGGVTHFGGTVGAANALSAVTTDAAGTTRINGGLVRTTGAQDYNDNVSVDIGAGTAPTAVTTTADGSVNFDGTLTLNDLAGANGLTVTAGNGNVTFTGQVTINDNDLTVASSAVTTITTGIGGTTGNVNINASAAGAGPIVLTGAINLTGAGSIVRLNTTGAGATVTQTGDIDADQLLLVGTAGYTLNNAGNGVNTLAASTTGQITYRNTDALAIGSVSGVDGVSSTSTVSLTAGGAVTQSQPVGATVLTVLTLDNGGASVILDNSLNEVTGIDLRARDAGNAANTAGTITYRDATGFNVEAVQTAANATLQSGGAVTQSGTIVAAGLELLGAGSYTLNLAGNDVDTLAANISGFAFFRDTDDLLVGTVNTAGITTSGNNHFRIRTGTTLGINAAVNLAGPNATLTVEAGGAVTQTATISAAGLQLLGAGPFTLNSANAITIALSGNTTDEVQFRNTVGYFIGEAGDSFGTTSGFTVTGEDLVLTTDSGTVTQGGVGSDVVAVGLELLGAGSYNLPNAGNDVDTLAANIGGFVILRDTDDLLVGTVNGTGTAGITTGSGNVTLTAGALTIGDGNGQDIAAGTAIVDLNVAGATEGAGSIITAGSLRLQGTGNFTLTEANNVGTIAANISGNLDFTDANTLTVGTVLGTMGITAPGDLVTVTVSTGDLTVSQNIATDGNTSEPGGNISLTASGGLITVSANITSRGQYDGLGNGSAAGGSITLLASGAIDTSAGQLVSTSGFTTDIFAAVFVSSAGGAVSITSTGGNVTTGVIDSRSDRADIAASGNGGAVTISAAAGFVLVSGTIDATSGFTGGAAGTGGDVTITAGSTVTVNAGINTQALVGIGDRGDVFITGGDHITQSAAGVIAADNATFTADHAANTADSIDILLGTADNNVSGTVTFAESFADELRDVIWRNVSATAMWPVFPAAITINDLTVQHTMTGIAINSGVQLQLKDLDLGGGAFDTGDLTLEAGGGDITQTAGSTLFIPGTTTLQASGDILLTEDNDFDVLPLSATSLVAGDGVVIIRDAVNVNISDINDIIIDVSDATVTGTGASAANLVSLIITSDSDNNDASGSSQIFLDDSNLATATAIVVTTTGAGGAGVQTYNGDLVLNQNTTLTSTMQAPITFNGWINSDGPGTPRQLDVNTGAITAFNGGMVGNINPLEHLLTDNDAAADGLTAGEKTQLTGIFITTDFQRFNDKVELTGDVVNTSTGNGNIDYLNTVDGDADGTRSLTLNTGGVTILNGAIGLGENNTFDNGGDDRRLVSLITNDDGAAANGPAGERTQIGAVFIALSGSTATFNDPVILTANLTIHEAGAGHVTFATTVDTDGTAWTLDVVTTGGGDTIFNGAVGGISLLGALTTDTAGAGNGRTFINGGSVTTSGTQTYNDAVIIGELGGATTTLTSGSLAGVNGVWFANTVDDDGSAGNANLVVNTQGITRFDALVGFTAPLTTLITDAGGQTSINNDPGNSLTYTPPASAGQLAAANIHTTGNQTYNDDVVLSANTAGDFDFIVRADDPGASIVFTAKLDGNLTTVGVFYALTSGQGLTIFSDTSSINQSQTGTIAPLQFIDSSRGPNVAFQTLNVTTDSQFIGGNVILGFVNLNGHDFTITASDITFAAGPGSVMPGGASADLTMRPLDPTSSIGIGGGAGAFNLDDADLMALADGFNSISIGRFDGSGTVTVGTATFTDPVRIQSPMGAIVVEGLINSTAGGVPANTSGAANDQNPFATDVDLTGARVNSETINGRGQNAYGQTGGSGPVNGSGVLLFGSGNTTIAMANVQTTGTPIFINDSFVLTTDVSLNTTAGTGNEAGADITITGRIMSNGDADILNDAVADATGRFGLTLNAGTGGNIDLQSSVGSTTATVDVDTALNLNFVTVVNALAVDFDGTVELSGSMGSVTVNAGGDINFRAAVTATGAVTIQNANNTTFASTVAANSVIQTAGAGTTFFTADVTTTGANGVNITSTGASGTATTAGVGIQLDGLTIDTSAGGGLVRFNGPALLSTAAVTITAGAGNIIFQGTLNGAQDLDLNSTGSITLAGLVGGTAALTSLDIIDGDATTTTGVTAVNGGGVTTTGAQNYGNNVTVGVADAAFTSTGGAGITFSGTLNGGQSVTVNTTGTTTFALTIGDTLPLTSLLTDADGGTTVSGATVTTSGTQIYNDTVTLTTGVNFTGSTVRFNESIAGAANTLTITGNAVFGDSVADAVVSGTLLVTGSTTIFVNTVVTAGTTQTYTGPVTLGSDANLTGTIITFNGTVNGSAAGNELLNIFGDAVLGNDVSDTVGFGVPLEFFTVSGTTLFNGGSVTTAGIQTYAGAATLATDLTLNGTTITFNGTVEGTADGAQSLTINGSAEFGNDAGDTVGAATPLELVSVSGATTFTGASVTTSTTAGGTGSQTYTGAAALAGNLLLTAAGDVTFGSTVNNTFNLTVTAAGTTRFNGAVGDTADLAILILDGGGTTVIATTQIDAMAVQFDDAVILAANTTVTGTSSIRFNSTITGANFNLTTIGGAAFTQFNGDVTGVGTLNTTGTATFLNTANISGAVLDFDDAIGIDAATVTLTGTTSVDFASSIGATGLGGGEAGNSLTINSPSITFNGSVSTSGADLIGILTTDGVAAGGGTTFINTATVSATVLDFNHAVQANTSTTLSGATSVDFAGTLNSQAAEANDVTILSPATTFNGIVGGAAGGALGTLNTDAAGTTTINTTGITAAVIDFDDAVVFEQSAMLTGTTSVDFASTVNSAAGEANSVTINSPTTAFHGVVGGAGGGALGTLSTDPAGTTTIDTTAVTAAVLDFNDAVVIDQDATLTGTTSVDFASTVNSATGEANDLTINSPITAFHGVVGGAGGGALGTLSTDPAGTTTIDTTAMTAAVLDFNDAVVIDQNAVLTGTTSVDFALTLNSQVNENNNLTINSPITAFHGRVGEASAFGILSTDDNAGAGEVTTIDTDLVQAATLDFNDDSVVTTQAATLIGTTLVDFSAATALTIGDGAAEALIVNGATVNFNGTVNSGTGLANSLAVNATTTLFGGAVGTGAGGALGTLTTDPAGTTAINGGAVTTTGAQIYGDAVTLNAAGNATTLTGVGISFGSTVRSTTAGEEALTIADAGTTTFGGAVGDGGQALASLTTLAGGTTAINGGSVTTTLGQSYGDNVTLGADAVLTSTTATGEDITFSGTINGAFDLVVTETGNGSINFLGAVGNTAPLTSLLVNAGPTAGSSIVIGGGTVTTVMEQTYNVPNLADAVNLTAGTVLTGTDITFNARINGTGNSLAIMGNAFFGNGAAHEVFAITTLTVSGSTTINSSAATDISTTGNQTYTGPVTLLADTTIRATGDTITFSSSVDGAFALDIQAGIGFVIFSGPVGAISAPTSIIDASNGDTVRINGGLLRSSGAITLGVVNITVDSALNTTLIESTGGGTILLGSVASGRTIGSFTDGEDSLTVTTGGTATIGGVVGPAGQRFSNFTINAGTINLNGTAVTTTGFQDYNGPANIGAALALTAGGSLDFSSTVNGANNLTLAVTGTSVFNGALGNTAGIGSGAGAAITINSTGTTEFIGAVNATSGIVQAVGAGTITFRENVTIAAGTIASTFNESVVLDGLTFTSGGAVTFGNAALVDTVTLSGGDVILAIAGATTVNALVDGGRDLIINSTGATTFNGAVGSVAALGDGTGASINIGRDAAAGPVTFAGTVRTESGITQSGASGLVFFDGNVTILGVDTPSTFNANVTLDGMTFTSAGAVTIGDVVGGDSLTLSEGDVVLAVTGVTTVNANVNGSVNLIINSSGATTFNAPLGSAATGNTLPIGDGLAASINIGRDSAAGPVTFISTVRTTTGINQTGASQPVTFGGDVTILGAGTPTTLNANVVLDGLILTSAGAVTFGDVVGADTVTLSSSQVTLDVFLATTVNATVIGNQDLVINSTGATIFLAPVGGATAATAIGDGAGGSIRIAEDGASGAVTFVDTVRTTTGIIQGGGAGLLFFDGDVTVLGAATPTALSANVTLDGLTFTSAGAITFGDVIGTDTLTLSEGTVTITSTGAGVTGNITFNANVTGAQPLIVNTAGATTFNAGVGGGFGGAVALTSVFTDGPGTVAINGGTVTTTGSQTFSEAATIGAGVGGTTTLTSTGGAAITFGATLDDDGTAAASNLIVNTTGTTTFTGVVGGITPLTSITTDFTLAAIATDITAINGGAVTTTGAQTYNENVTLGANTVLTSTTTGDITIGALGPNGVYGPTTLTTTAAAPVTLVANGTANFKVNAAVNGVVTFNGTDPLTYIVPNSANTGINLYLSNPTSAFVFIFSQPPAAIKINEGVIELGLLFSRDAAVIFADPVLQRPISTLSSNQFGYLALGLQGRAGVSGSDRVVSIFDLVREEEEQRRKK
jgi:mucin-19